MPFCRCSTNESNNRMNYKDVEKAVYSWGYYPALVYLLECERQERYKDCAVIKKVLDKIAEGREWYLSSKTDPTSMQETYDKIIGSRKDPSNLIHNMPHYIEEFKNQIE